MEKYYLIAKDSRLYKDYFSWKESAKIVNEHVKDFLKEHDIETNRYAADNQHLYIVPTEKDLEKFNTLLIKKEFNGLRRFRSNSKINKAWVKSLEDKEIKVRRKPMLGFYFTIFGRHQTRLFAIEDDLYCSIRSEDDYEKPEWAQEIKASEFWKTVEDYEQS